MIGMRQASPLSARAPFSMPLPGPARMGNVAGAPQGSVTTASMPQQQQPNAMSPVDMAAAGVGIGKGAKALGDAGVFDATQAALGNPFNNPIAYNAGAGILPGSAGLASNAGLAGLQGAGEFGGAMGAMQAAPAATGTAMNLAGSAGLGGLAAGGEFAGAMGAASGAGSLAGSTGVASALGSGAAGAGAAGAGATGAATALPSLAALGPVGLIGLGILGGGLLGGLFD